MSTGEASPRRPASTGQHRFEALDVGGKRVVLLLQGGGALGAYQVGAFQALSAICTKIDWVAGISIGALNAAVIAGNTPEEAPRKLERLWHDLAQPPYDAWLLPFWPFLSRRGLSPLVPKYLDWALSAVPFGQPNFFTSRVLSPRNPWLLQWFGPREPRELGFYSPEPLRETLTDPRRAYVDWDRINRDGEGTRLSLGATNVDDGEFTFFNSFEPKTKLAGRQTLSVDHVLAAGALPPAFAPYRIEGTNGTPSRYYWDGGLVSNTPLLELGDELRSEDTIVFDIQLWDRKHYQPLHTLDEAIWRERSITFASRKKQAEELVRKHQAEVDAGYLATRLEIVQIMYEENPTEPAFWAGDADFSLKSYRERFERGKLDMESAFEESHVAFAGSAARLYRRGSYLKHLATD
ncbi:MAG: patatin-like phospholipase family protein [Candidatus Baltobacteraceae bacterium]|jgi:NTE family protein